MTPDASLTTPQTSVSPQNSAASPALTTRERAEADELSRLSPFACKSAYSRGRVVVEAPCPIRTAFQRDRDRILHSKAFRRLKHKTQVFIAPTGDHYRTRLTHSLEVAQIARTIARALHLNEDLTEAIALGHDLGHPPFGHAGEAALNTLVSGASEQDSAAKTMHGYDHTQQSLRIVTVLEPLNLTRETLDGIAQQRKGCVPDSLEAQVVEVADRLAYLHHDAEDAIRAGLMREEDIPPAITNVLGNARHLRLDCMIQDLIAKSWQQERICMSDDVRQAMFALRAWMFEHIYHAEALLGENDKVVRVMTFLLAHYRKHPHQLPEKPLAAASQPTGEALEQAVIDYVSGMTDRFALATYRRLALPLLNNVELDRIDGETCHNIVASTGAAGVKACQMPGGLR